MRRIALLLSTDMLPGECELQVGMYDHAAPKKRYELIAPVGGTYVVVERLTIR